MKTAVLFVAVAMLGLLIGIGVAWQTRDLPPTPGSAGGAAVGDLRPHFRHGDLDGQWVEVDQFDGQLLLVNFWATWCAPCRREMPVLEDAAQAHDGRLTVVGIAMDEPVPVMEFVEELGISYPILVGSTDVINTQRAWGNSAGALPYTVLVDPDGIIRWQHLGEVSAQELDEQLRNWL
jgi:thiol-disulfide isomerase/thioredoxin